MLGFPVGVFVANGLEWYFHKVWLHEYPSQYRNSPFFTHIAHHKREYAQGNVLQLNALEYSLIS